MNAAAAAADADVYIAALQPAEIFADATYQRVLDVPRARKMAGTWDRRLAGILGAGVALTRRLFRDELLTSSDDVQETR